MTAISVARSPRLGDSPVVSKSSTATVCTWPLLSISIGPLLPNVGVVSATREWQQYGIRIKRPHSPTLWVPCPIGQKFVPGGIPTGALQLARASPRLAQWRTAPPGSYFHDREIIVPRYGPPHRGSGSRSFQRSGSAEKSRRCDCATDFYQTLHQEANALFQPFHGPPEALIALAHAGFRAWTTAGNLNLRQKALCPAPRGPALLRRPVLTRMLPFARATS
ncbi:hypothetical protein CBM2634_U110015 [Cupriavidus taiwanensis]|uniref:Uncharacterized protein n=1 Tax=Cupriavidus taiwanensis TaxID=164546 RepID=A0A375JFU7_9BURK|nr:hypothetical protein CBM2634_U110015 [Cupriavidus taiwanensis]